MPPYSIAVKIADYIAHLSSSLQWFAAAAAAAAAIAIAAARLAYLILFIFQGEGGRLSCGALTFTKCTGLMMPIGTKSCSSAV